MRPLCEMLEAICHAAAGKRRAAKREKAAARELERERGREEGREGEGALTNGAKIARQEAASFGWNVTPAQTLQL